MTMMSIFSSFDAAFAESFGLSWHSERQQRGDDCPTGAVNPSTASVKYLSGGLKRVEQKKGPSPSPVKEEVVAEKVARRMTIPRIAVEFDGVNCFETIVPF